MKLYEDMLCKYVIKEMKFIVFINFFKYLEDIYVY